MGKPPPMDIAPSAPPTAHAPAVVERRSWDEPFDAPPGSTAERLGRRFRGRPGRVCALVDVAGVVALALVLSALGLLLTGVLLDGPLARWDLALNRRLVATRSGLVNGWSAVGSSLGDTLTVIAIATAVTIGLAIRRAWAQAAFFVGALLIEVTSFVVTTFVVDRTRPRVPKLDVAPPTSSFPSGHAAASIVLFVGIAVVVTSLTRNLAIRAVAWTLAVLIPPAVAIARMQRGMHHATDIAGSLIGALGCLVVSAFAVRAALVAARTETHEQDEGVAA